jgi:hypothetical protein
LFNRRPDTGQVPHLQGRLVTGKPEAERTRLAQRTTAMDAAVLAVQEVEDVTPDGVATTELAGLGYQHVVLVEGNDPRLIDVGLLSRLPVGGVTSWRHTVEQPTDTDPAESSPRKPARPADTCSAAA